MARKFINFGNNAASMEIELTKDEKHVLRVLYNNGCWGKGAMYARNIVYKGVSTKILGRLEKKLKLISKSRHKRGWKYFLVKEKRDVVEEVLGIFDVRERL